MTENQQPREEKKRASGLKSMRGILMTQTAFENKLDRQRAQALLIISYVLFPISIAGLIFSFNGSDRIFAYSTIYLAASLMIMLMIRFKRINIAVFALILVLDFQLLIGADVLEGGLSLPILMLLPIIVGSYFLGAKWSIYLGILNVVLFAGRGLFDLYMNDAPPNEVISFIVRDAVATIAGSAIIWAFFRNMFAWVDQAELTDKQMGAAVQLSNSMVQSENLYQLLQTSIETIKDTLIYQYVQVFMIDEDKTSLLLEAGTGEAGGVMLAKGYTLIVGSDTLPGQCAETGETTICNDADQDQRFIPVEGIEGSSSEAAIPLIVNNELVGVLDIFCNIKGRFTDETLQVLNIVAAQIAAAIDKTNLVTELQTRIRENEGLLQESQRNLNQIEEMASRLTMESWKQYLEMRSGSGSVGFELKSGQITPTSEWTPLMNETYRSGKAVHLSMENDRQVAGVPLKVRGETIGILTVENRPTDEWSEYDLEIMEELGDRIATAIDNTRLYEQASMLAGREQIINQVSQDIQKATTLDQVLQSALSELSNIVGASKGMVRISSKQNEALPQDKSNIINKEAWE